MIFDSIAFGLTAYKSVELWRQGSRGLVHVVMRDGKFCFIMGTRSSVDVMLSQGVVYYA